MYRQLRESTPEPESEPEPEPELELDMASCSDFSPNEEPELASDAELNIHCIGAVPFVRIAKKPDHEIFAVSIADIDKALAPKVYTDPATKLPEEYHDLLEVFSREESDRLPKRRPYDHGIKVLRKYLDDNLSKGFIRASSSPVASPVIFVKKPGGGLRFCVDYRGLNAITVENRYPIPLIQETLNRLSKAGYYIKLDIIAAFNRLRIADGDEWLTAFRTRYGLFEYLHFVNDVLRPYLDIFCTAYLDDILIYSENLHEHREHVRSVLNALKEAGLQLDIDKCEFYKNEVVYLSYVISTNRVRMDLKKVQAITD
ncbi:RNA-directed DNA polymerase [Pyrenophora tritici-repentis]|nr:RNA-directed DNA polymerase [Pyrenophora tritici-repentis]